jgi:WD40 repeat protein
MSHVTEPGSPLSKALRPNDASTELTRRCGPKNGLDQPRPRPDPAPWPVIDGYEVLGELGRGGMGVVYLARQLPLNRLVALKMILAGPHAGPEALARLRTEAEAVARLRHPNIVQIHEVGNQDGHPYLALEYVEGNTLADNLAGMPYAPRPAARLLETLARAVHHAHERGIVHRDLKPSNVLLTVDGAPKIADFGLAKHVGAGECLSPGFHTQTGLVMGTPSYMAPEQAAGRREAVGSAIDVYALGAVLYELLTGRPPFQGETDLDTLLHVQWREPLPPSRLRPELPRDLETICLKCLQKEPAQRYPSARLLAEDLAHFLAGKSVRARPVGVVGQLARWGRRNPALAAVSGLSGTALAAVVVLSVAFALQQHGAAETLRRQQEQTRAARAAEQVQRDLSDEQRREREVLAAGVVLDRALDLVDKGDVNRGLLWLARSLEHTPPEAGDLQRAVRGNLAAWRPQLPLQAVLEHPAMVCAVAFSPDGKTALTGGGDGGLRLWDAATGKQLGPPLPNRDAVFAVAFSPDGRWILSGGDDPAARLWDAATGWPAGEPFPHPGRIRAVAFSPDGQTILTAGLDGSARLWAVASRRPLGQPLLHGNWVRAAAFSPDGQTVLTASMDQTARLWDAGTGAPRAVPPLAHEGGVLAVAFSPNGKRVLTGCADQTARLWDAVTGQLVARSPKQSGQVASVAFSPDGATLFLGTNGRTSQLFDTDLVKRGEPLVHGGAISAAAFSPDGRTILAGSWDAVAWLWRVVPESRPAQLLPHAGPGNAGGVQSVAYAPDGRTVLTGSHDGTARLWDARTGRPLEVLLGHHGPVHAVAYSPDGRTVLTGSEDRTARLWDAATGRPLGEPLLLPGAITPWTIAFSPDGKTLLTGCADGTALLWDAATGKRVGPPLQHADRVSAVAFSPDGKVVLTGSWDRTARLWDTATGRRLADLEQPSQVTAAVFSPDGRLVLIAGVEARLWKLATGEPLGPSLPCRGQVRAAAFSPDGSRLLTGHPDGRARLWDVATGKLLGDALVHRDVVRAVAFSRDGARFLTASFDGSARVWETSTRKPLGPPLEHPGWVVDATFSPDGRTVLTGCADGAARLWPVPPPVAGDVERIVVWTQVLTGAELDADGTLRSLDAATLRQRRQRLQELGGPPMP